MEQRGNWTITDSQVKYENPWLKVIEHQVIRPDGKPGVYGVTEIGHGSYVLPVDENKTVYLAKQFRFPLNTLTLEAVSGGIEHEETPLEGAQRELKEELGIKAKEWTSLGHVEPLTSPHLGTQYLFLARKLFFGQSCQDGDENITLVKTSLEDAVRAVMESEIIDSPSCVLILKAREYLSQKLLL